MNNKSCGDIKWIISFLKIISDENRLKILCFLKSWEKCVCEIVDFMKLPQNLISHHLKKLKDENIVVSKKEWLYVKYSINDKDVDKYLTNFNNLLTNKKSYENN